MIRRSRIASNTGVTGVTRVTLHQNASISPKFAASSDVTPSDLQGVTGVTVGNEASQGSPQEGSVIGRPAVVKLEALLDMEIGDLPVRWSRRGRRYRRSR